jgi:hypothetical protein
MRFLTDEWLCDVATDYPGKCTIIAATCMILERALLLERPVVFVTAGHRACGKTTTLHMIVEAATGLPAQAAAWSTDPEERRKALFSYLDLGLENLIWDNIAKGSAISDPSIEKSCTLEFYTDRVLGKPRAKQSPPTRSNSSPAITSHREATWRRAPSSSASPSISSIPKTANSRIPTPSNGPVITAARSSPLSTPSSSATHAAAKRKTRDHRGQPVSKHGGT